MLTIVTSKMHRKSVGVCHNYVFCLLLKYCFTLY